MGRSFDRWGRRGWQVLAVSLALFTFGFGEARAEAVSAKQWTADVCAAQTSYAEAVKRSVGPRGLSNLESELLIVKNNPAGSARNFPTIKSRLISVLDATSSAAARLASAIKKSGTPHVPQGAKIAKALLVADQTLRALMTDAKKQAHALRTRDTGAFVTTVDKIGADLVQAEALDKKSTKTIERLDATGAVAPLLAECRAAAARVAPDELVFAVCRPNAWFDPNKLFALPPGSGTSIDPVQELRTLPADCAGVELLARAPTLGSYESEPAWFQMRLPDNTVGWAYGDPCRVLGSGCVAAILALPEVEPRLATAGLADLALQVTPVNYMPGQRCFGPGPIVPTYIVELVNQGTAASPRALEYSLGQEVKSAEARIRGLEPGESISLGNVPGDTTVTIDPNARVQESDKSNNQMYLPPLPNPGLICE